MSNVLYLHGFLSSPQSVKAQSTVQWFAEHHPDVVVHTPALSNYPSKVFGQLEGYINSHPELLQGGLKVIGSSMGGYLATYLVERFGGKAVLINPAVKPYELLIDYLGEHVNPYTNEVFELVAEDMDVLKALDTEVLNTPDAYHVMLQTGDETLDYRQAQAKYEAGTLVIEQGGDHSFINYPNHLPAIARFLRVG